MRAEFAEQYGCVCLVLDGNEKADDVIERAYEDEAIFFDGESECLCLRFQGRPQELYTESAVIRSLGSNA
jgi:hypothetical protein